MTCKRVVDQPGVRARLDALFPGQHRFTLTEAGGGVLARVELPLART